MSRILAHRGGAIIAIVSVITLVMLAALAASNLVGSIRPARHTAASSPPTTGEVRLALHSTGLDAQSLTACGATPTEAAAVVAAARAILADSIDSLRAADSAPATSTATSYLQANLPTVQAAWNEASQ